MTRKDERAAGSRRETKEKAKSKCNSMEKRRKAGESSRESESVKNGARGKGRKEKFKKCREMQE